MTKMRDGAVSIVKREAETRLPVGIVNAWLKKVDADIRKNPFTTAELDRLEHDAGVAARTELEQGDPQKQLLAYGATLLLAAVAPEYAFFLQLGDGDILTVWDHTAQTQVEAPLPADAALIANETTSLCMPNAQRLFRFRFQCFQGVPPSLILLSTDGYANSFLSTSDFHKVGSDLLQILRSDESGHRHGNKLKQRVELEKNLKMWLEDASIKGSGDDVTVAVIFRQDLTRQSRNQNNQTRVHHEGHEEHEGRWNVKPSSLRVLRALRGESFESFPQCD